MSKSIAEEIMEPLEIILKKLIRLSNDSVEVAVSQTRVHEIAQEMDAAGMGIEQEQETEMPKGGEI